jgi:hypothetical protein
LLSGHITAAVLIIGMLCPWNSAIFKVKSDKVIIDSYGRSVVVKGIVENKSSIVLDDCSGTLFIIHSFSRAFLKQPFLLCDNGFI